MQILWKRFKTNRLRSVSYTHLLPKEYNDKWELLSKFINIEYPAFDYPNLKDKKQMKYTISHNNFKNNNMLWDNLPWICYSKENRGIEILKAEDEIIEEMCIRDREYTRRKL